MFAGCVGASSTILLRFFDNDGVVKYVGLRWGGASMMLVELVCLTALSVPRCKFAFSVLKPMNAAADRRKEEP